MWRRVPSQLRALTPKCNVSLEISRPCVALYLRNFSSQFGNASMKKEVELGNFFQNLFETRLNVSVNRHASLTSPCKVYGSCLSQDTTMVPRLPRRFITTGAISQVSEDASASSLTTPRIKFKRLDPRLPRRFITTGAISQVSEDASASSLTTPRIKFKRLDKTAAHIMQILDKEAVQEVRTQNEIPDIKPGYIIQLKVEVPENKRRVSTVKGIVIARRNSGLNTTFRLRRLVAGVGVENLFHLYSPNLKEIKVLDKKKVRRAKLYYLRDKMNALKKH